jgi:PilZ domain
VPRQDPAALSANQAVRDRRLKVRFPLDLSVHFRPLSGAPFSGAGRAVNVSSGGVLVVSKQDVWRQGIRVGAWVELKIEWPSLLEGKIPLQLFAVGRVVRLRTSDFAAAFERYQFRTVRSSGLPHARLGERVVQWPA